MRTRTEMRGGKEYRVTVLPDASPPKNRSHTSRYHLSDVGKGGDEAKTLRLRRKRKHG